MEYIKIINGGYILGVAHVPFGGNISKEEFDNITEIIHQMPEAPEGFYYRLTENFEWELCEIHEEAAEEDYQKSLENLGVDFNA